jgi:hypothetical protein
MEELIDPVRPKSDHSHHLRRVNKNATHLALDLPSGIVASKWLERLIGLFGDVPRCACIRGCHGPLKGATRPHDRLFRGGDQMIA